MPSQAPIIVYYDGLCALCNQWVRRLLRWDTHGIFRFATQQGPHFSDLISRHPQIKNLNSIIIYQPSPDGDRLYAKSDAILFAIHQLKGPWRLLSWLKFIPKRWRDHLYHFIAENRYHLFGRYDFCPAPPPEHRSRFID
jgi:predicted DCC family thiol-disulfide oxidoreductase YuxK